jgi:hypothetical protein
MPRAPRIFFAGAIYRIITRGEGRRRLFRVCGHHDPFTKGLRQEVKRSGWIVPTFFWMPNHLIGSIGVLRRCWSYPRNSTCFLRKLCASNPAARTLLWLNMKSACVKRKGLCATTHNRLSRHAVEHGLENSESWERPDNGAELECFGWRCGVFLPQPLKRELRHGHCA